MSFKPLFISSILCWGFMTGHAQEKKGVDYTPEIHGTIRAKYEHQTVNSINRFQLRNTRVSVNGNVTPIVSYKLEVDLCEEGEIKMKDAYTRINAFKNFNLTLGQFRKPFTIDAHRAPHLQHFANRSFIAKHMGSSRDVGASVTYKLTSGFPITLDAGIFNGSGLTNQKNYWTKGIDYAVKAQFFLPEGFNVTLSTQKIKPNDIAVNMYDAGIYFQSRGWHIEAEYMLKHYSKEAFENAKAFNSFICYDMMLKKSVFRKISFLGRFEYMSDNSDGKRYLDGKVDPEGTLKINDYERKRATGGITLSFSKPFLSDIRINYEKYFYRKGAIAKPSEQDKLVIEVSTRF